MSDEIVVGGQNVQQVDSNFDTSLGNELLAQENDISFYVSDRVKRLITSPDFKGDNGYYNTSEIKYRRNLSPGFSTEELMARMAPTETSDTVDIIRDSMARAGIQMSMIGDRALISLGGVVSKVSGNEFGVEMRDKAYDSLRIKANNMALVSGKVADMETWTARITEGALSLGELMLVGLLTGGVGAYVQMGTDAFGEGTYNNMLAYAKQNNGSIDGYEGNWSNMFLDFGNSLAQLWIEKTVGFGRNFIRGAGGTLVREAINGFAQETSQGAIADINEYLKGNINAQELVANAENWLIAGVLGSGLQGVLAAATHKGSRMKADAAMQDIYVEANKRLHPEKPIETVQKEGRAFAKEINDRIEENITVDVYQELVDRTDVNNDRGRLRENAATEITKAWESAKGEPLNDSEVAAVERFAKHAASESIRMAISEGVPITDTLVGRIVADGPVLKLRELAVPSNEEIMKKADALGLDKSAVEASVAEERERQAKQRNIEENFLKDIQMGIDASKAKPMTREERIAKNKEVYAAKLRGQDKQTFATKIRHAGYLTPGAAEDIGLNPAAINQDKVGFARLVRANGKIKRGDSAVEILADMGYGVYNTDGSINWDAVHNITREGVDNLRNVNYREDEKATQFDQAEFDALTPRQQEYARLSGKLDTSTFDAMTEVQQENELRRLRNKDRIPGIMTYKDIIIQPDATIETIMRDFTESWLEGYFKSYRSGRMPEFLRPWWKEVESRIGLRPNDISLNVDAVDKFARGFEAYVKSDGQDFVNNIMKQAYEKMSGQMAIAYDDALAEADLKPEIDSFMAQNEKIAERGAIQEEGRRSEARAEARKAAEDEYALEKGGKEYAKVLSEKIEQSAELFERKASQRLSREFGTEIETDTRQSLKDEQIEAEAIVNEPGGVEFALDILSGKKESKIRQGTWFRALENYAKANNDAILADRIQATGILAQTTEIARDFAALKDYTSFDGTVDAIRAIDAINSDYNYDKLSRKEKQRFDEEMKVLEQQIKETDDNWNIEDIFNSWECVL